jgi:thiol-disulfide isomerase/thioredoxin
MRDLDDHPVHSSNYLGSVVVLNFWATWCPPCREEIPELNAFQMAHRSDGVVVVGASVDEEGATVVRDFVRRMKISYPVLLADPPTQARYGGASTGPEGTRLTLPTTVVIDRKGNYAARYLGAMTREELDKAVAPLLSTSP